MIILYDGLVGNHLHSGPGLGSDQNGAYFNHLDFTTYNGIFCIFFVSRESQNAGRTPGLPFHPSSSPVCRYVRRTQNDDPILPYLALPYLTVPYLSFPYISYLHLPYSTPPPPLPRSFPHIPNPTAPDESQAHYLDGGGVQTPSDASNMEEIKCRYLNETLLIYESGISAATIMLSAPSLSPPFFLLEKICLEFHPSMCVLSSVVRYTHTSTRPAGCLSLSSSCVRHQFGVSWRTFYARMHLSLSAAGRRIRL